MIFFYFRISADLAGSKRCKAAEKVRILSSAMRQSVIRSASQPAMNNITVGVLALQGAFREHLDLLKKASEWIYNQVPEAKSSTTFSFLEVRTEEQLSLCDALIIPGGESTTISLVAARSNLLEPLRHFVK